MLQYAQQYDVYVHVYTFIQYVFILILYLVYYMHTVLIQLYSSTYGTRAVTRIAAGYVDVNGLLPLFTPLLALEGPHTVLVASSYAYMHIFFFGLLLLSKP